jgi:purine-binding chemotaxis protein CheW
MNKKTQTSQYSTFYIDGLLYGIDVMKVQEITKALPMTRVPLAPKYVRGLINLRGQISTAIQLSELFEFNVPIPVDQMNVVCKITDILISFLVDRIGDVMEVDEKDFETTPDTVPENIRRYIFGIYKTNSGLLSVIDVDAIVESITKSDQQKSIEQNLNQ